MEDTFSATHLWTLSCGRDAAQCVVAQHPLGIELRYLINDRPLISRVFESWDSLAQQATTWRTGLEARGWGLVSASAA
jgi:hypothetical protein